MSWYCDVAPGHPIHEPYHDREYGFPLQDEAELLERLALEIFQAGLSWELILKKRAGIVTAFEGFAVDRVADFGEGRIRDLLEDERIVRNRLKVRAIVHDAGVIRAFRESHGGFSAWLSQQHPRSKRDWVQLFKKTYRYTGGEITGEFLMSIGYLPGSHREDCPVYERIAAIGPPWMEAPEGTYETAP